MIVVDVNLLLYAVISGFPRHREARTWFESALNGSGEIGLAAPAIFGFLRLSTNPRVMTSPMTAETAVAYVQGWLERPNVSFLVPGPRHLDIAFALLRDMGTAGNLTTDVQLAAYALERDAELCSNDADFGRFPELRWVDPLA